MVDSRHPLVFFWIATYNDGTALPQFDPKTYKANKITDIDQSKLVKIGWYPFSFSFAKELNDRDIPVVANPLLPKYEVTIDGNKRYILFTRNFISQEEYHFCTLCKQEFHVGASTKFKIDGNQTIPICPNCGGSDYWVCSQCGKRFNTFDETKSTPANLGGSGHCDKCGGYLHRVKATSERHTRERRWRLYVIGYQETINNKNYKMLMYIHENGDVEIKYE